MSGRFQRRVFLQLLAGPMFASKFTDVTAAAGLSRARNVSGAPSDKRYLVEEMGCGVALFDYDNDGWLDIFLVNGSAFDLPPSSRKPGGYLFRNNRDGTFTDVTREAGITHTGWGQGCCVGDYDNDGFDDLFVSCWGRNVLYHNNGNGTFTDVSVKAGVAGSADRWGAGCCFLDYDRDGRLDLFVANYVSFDKERAPLPGESIYCRYSQLPVPCGPQGFTGGTQSPVSQSRRRRFRRCFREVRDCQSPRIGRAVRPPKLAAHRVLRYGSSGRGLRQRRLAGYLRCLRHRA